jgi:hypothetical protein
VIADVILRIEYEAKRRKTHDMVADNVMIAIFGVELDGKATDITNGVCAPLFTAGGAQTEQYFRLLPNAVEELG